MPLLKFYWALFVVLMCKTSYIHSWNSVQISTCEAPLVDTPLSLCCFTENLPNEASVYFSTTSGHVARIGSSCDLWYPSNEYEANFSWNCSTKGNVTVYSITFLRVLSDENDNELWQCGFYGNKAETRLTVLDNHTSGTWLPNTNPRIQFMLSDPASAVGTLRLYRIQLNQTLLEVNLSSNAVIRQSVNVNYSGDVLQDNFSAELLNIRTQDNGTYVCEFESTTGSIRRLGFTLVVLGKPKLPEIQNTSIWKVTGNKMAGNVTCDAISGSASPLFYQSVMSTQWFIPDVDDWPKGDIGYNVSTNGSVAYISNIDCGKMLLPIYCKVTEQTEVSDISAAFFPHTMCSKTGASAADHGTGDPTFRAMVIGICVSVTSAVFVFVITMVVARSRVKRRLKKCCGCFRKCCRCCADALPSSDSDSDSDLEEVIRRSRQDDRRHPRGDRQLTALADGLRPPRDSRSVDFQRALERIAQEESRQNYEHSGRQTADSLNGSENPFFLQFGRDDDEPDAERIPASSFPSRSLGTSGQNESSTEYELQGAVGGAPLLASPDEDLASLKEVETLLEQHHNHLGRDVVSLQVSRDNIVENLIGYYTEESLAMSRVTVKFMGEEGMDCGGVTYDMYTTFWSKAQEEFFIGSEAVVPYLPPHRFTDDSKYRILGRILSHTIAVMKAFPIHMCKSTIIAMIYETTDVAADVVLEDFLYFLDDHDRNLVTTAINDFNSLTTEQTEDLMTVFERYDYAVRISADSFKHHVTQLARHVICIRPRPLLDRMRSGIPQKHLHHFWSRFHLNTLDILFRALKPSADRVIARLKPSEDRPNLSRRQNRVMKFLKDLLREMSEPELETFLHFVTGKKSVPRDKITIEFTTESGKLRMPKAHTCSNMMELPESYEDYDTFRSEFKHLLASDEALKMSME